MRLLLKSVWKFVFHIVILTFVITVLLGFWAIVLPVGMGWTEQEHMNATAEFIAYAVAGSLLLGPGIWCAQILLRGAGRAFAQGAQQAKDEI